LTAPLDAVRTALAGEPAWLVGGAVRDKLLGRPLVDLDVAVAGDPRAAARTLAAATGGAPFALSEAFGGWRVVGRGEDWQVDLLPLRDGDLNADLAARDFTINAMAEPVAGGPLVDPHGGARDLEARTLRMVAPRAFADDPLRTIRAVRLAVELDLVVEPATLRAAREHAPSLVDVAAERTFAELRRIVGAPAPVPALELMERAGVTAVVLPELVALHGVDQNVFHHRDVHDHTLEVLDAVVSLERDPAGGGLGEHGPAVDALLREPLADGLTRWGSMRFAALLHDAAKPATSGRRADGRGSSFVGHDVAGADLARDVLRRLRASERLAYHVAALTRHHLRLGFLVHEGPLTARTAHRYLTHTAPYEVDVTVFTVADRLATRGRNAEPAIAAHLALAREMLGHALARRAAGPATPLVRGDELAAALHVRRGPELGELLARLEEDRYAGEVTTREEAIERAREYLTRPPRPG